MKKNLIILLIMPFIIALISVISLNITFNTFYGDIEKIDWKFEAIEALSVSEGNLDITATPVVQEGANLAPGNDLVYSVRNKDESITEPLAEIIEENGKYYLHPLGNLGEVIIRVENEKGNIFNEVEIVIYKSGVIIFNPVIQMSQNNIDSNIYYGLYDLNDNYQKQQASVDFQLRVLPSELKDSLVIDTSDNVSIEMSEEVDTSGSFTTVSFKVKMKSAGHGYFSFSPDNKFQTENEVSSRTFNFEVVDGVNVYDYDQLLACTNRSKEGEVVCLRKHFVSLDTYQASMINNETLFGNYDTKKGTFSFADEIYEFETTFNQEYIKQWNAFASTHPEYDKLSNKVKAGLHIQKDFYGNGYSINMHDLTYPKGHTDYDGVTIPTLTDTDLFRGPLPFYCLGDPTKPNSLLAEAYGQDNCGVYVSDDGVLINDVNVSNCKTPQSLQFFNYVGNVIDINAKDVTIKNSRFQNGKSILRAFSSLNLLIDNCLFQTSMNFLIITGSNEYEKDNQTITSYFNKGGSGDELLNQYLLGQFENKSVMKEKLDEIQKLLNEDAQVKGVFKGSMIIRDTYFSGAGLSCICFESLFNGPFLYEATPSLITDLFGLANDMASSGAALIPTTPKQVSGVSYPVTVEIQGDTRFYDYKDVDSIDLSGLINENISALASQVLGRDRQIDIDTIFPLKSTLINMANSQGCIYKDGDKRYVSIPICYYGGGLNISTITTTKDVSTNTKTFNVDFASKYLDLPASNLDIQGGKFDISGAMNIALKCVVVTTGFSPFKFTMAINNGYLFGESPKISDLQNRG